MTVELAAFEKTIGYAFQDQEKLVAALRHASNKDCGRNGAMHSETLEFLGDAVLDLVIGHELMQRRPDLREGDLSRWRASLVSRDALACVAEDLDMAAVIELGPAAQTDNGAIKTSILANSVESVIGAIYQDSGFENAKTCILAWFAGLVGAGFNPQEFDPKTYLQEWAQSFGARPEYELVSAVGAAHSKVYKVAAVVAANQLGVGEGPSKKKASIEAARIALSKLKSEGKLSTTMTGWAKQERELRCED